MSNEITKKQKFYEEKLGYTTSLLSDIMPFLEREDVTEIMLNGDGKIRLDTWNGTQITDVRINQEKAEIILKTLSNFNNKAKTNIVSGILPTGDRFEGITGKAAHNKTIFAIRKKATRILTLDEYVGMNFITEREKEYITQNVLGEKNILIVGGTSSGKTTFANACLNVLKDSGDRIIILEDTPELQCSADDTVKLQTTETEQMIELLQSTMRLNPTRIIVGELRKGIDTLELLKAWNSGHSGGMSTIHANDCLGGLLKLEQYLDEEIETDMSLLIANSVNIIINIIRGKDRRYVREIKEVKGYDKKEKEYILEDIKKIELRKGS